MAGPWEKYAAASAPAASAPEAGPWAKYAATSSAPQEGDPVTGQVPRGFYAVTGADGRQTLRRQLGARDIAQSVLDLPGVGTAANLATGAYNLGAKAISGLAGLVTGGNADVVRGVQESLSIEPAQTRDPVSQVLERAQRGAEAVSRPLENAVASLPPGSRTAIEAAAEAVPDVAGVLGARVPLARAARASTTVEGAANVRGGDVIERGRALGYKFRPSDVRSARPGEKTPGLWREGLDRPNDLRRDTTVENQATTTRLAAEELGATNVKALTEADFAKLREAPLKTYDEVGNAVGTFTPSANYYSELRAAARREGLEPSVRRKILAQTEQYALEQMSGPDALKTISALRRRAAKQLRSDDVLQNDMGAANRAIADALEAELGRQLEAQGNTQLLSQFQEARTALAKIHDVESATKGGQVDAQALARLARKGVPLTGRLKTIADVAEAAPNVVRHSTRATGVGNSVKADTLVGVAKDAVKGAISKLPGMDVMSEGFQSRHFGRQATPTERSYIPDIGRRQVVPPAAPRAPQFESVPFTETPGVVPARAVTLADRLELAPEPVRNPVELPPVPDRLTADVPPPTPSGGLPFTPSTPIAAQLAEDFGLSVPSAEGIPFRPPSLAATLAGDLELGRPTRPGELTLAPHSVIPTQGELPLQQPPLSLALELEPPAGTAPARIYPGALADQLGLGLGEPLMLKRPPGKVGKPKK